ncbi:TonB-dependent receptor [Haloferula rosea]|uniref:TonB-dependent receptor n=1 Tax=Haloferula rosea TaxID=490093 RepID=A0A934RG51_9BACT|nr:TonB-dependent receptor [Haloferula rosea]MBK1828958.1 TonB-dependent receptor [Haloferula rosea]
MNPFRTLSQLTAITVVSTSSVTAQSLQGTLDPLTVDALDEETRWTSGGREVTGGGPAAADGGDLLRGLPGVAVMRNGPQSGIAQIRGLGGDRVRIKIDDRTITPACPNHMDPPLHYAHVASGDLVELFAGVSPVSAGGDSIAGTIRLLRPEPDFAAENTGLVGGELMGSFRGDREAWGADARLFAATEDLRGEYRGSWINAGDLRFPGGTVRASGFETQRHTWIGSWRTDGGFISVDTGFSRSRDAGTPALPMDMVRDDSWHLGVHQRERFDWGLWETRLYVHDVDHLMDNFTLRPAAMRMQAPAASRDYGIASHIEMDLAGGLLRSGLDLHRAEFEAEQVNAMGLRRDTFRDNRRERYGWFGEWEYEWADDWEGLFGVRSDYVQTRAGAVRSQFGGPAVAADQAAFNAGKRTDSDLLVDVMAALRWQFREDTRLELAVGLKNRAPSLVERYLWTPANASAGLADGRTYLGNTALDPESAWQFALGIHHERESWSASLTPFYQIVDDYIEGRPIARFDRFGQPVLQFQNINRAELYGAEVEFEVQLHERLDFRANASWVRGCDTATGDPLYRIAPLRGLVALDYEHAGWEAALECEWADAQNRVSRIQNEPTTPGYGVFHFRLAREFPHGVRVEAGVENLLDKEYADHLGGINRVAASDVGIGQRIPNAGRFGYASVSWAF